MAVQEYTHTRKVLINDVALGSATMRAALINTNYTFAAAQTSIVQVQGLSLSDILAPFTIEFTDKYRINLETLVFPGVTGNVKGVQIYLDGFVGAIDRPVLFYIPIPEGEFISTDYRLFWETAIFEW